MIKKYSLDKAEGVFFPPTRNAGNEKGQRLFCNSLPENYSKVRTVLKKEITNKLFYCKQDLFSVSL